MYAKKSLGQHFLRSTRALDSIIEAGKITPGETILEIGPGEGVLTERLLGASGLVLAVEKDDELYEKLKTKFANEIQSKKLILIHDDILNFEFKNYNLAPSPYKLVANIPYNITGAILEKFLSASHQPSLCVLLVQDEVAKRVVARDGKESILSISVKAYGKPEYVEKVLAGSFVPAPTVNSAILAIYDISKGFFGEFSEEFFFRVVKAGFKAKRKKLSSNLATEFDKNSVENAFQKLSLDPNVRAEDVPVGVWGQITANLLV